MIADNIVRNADVYNHLPFSIQENQLSQYLSQYDKEIKALKNIIFNKNNVSIVVSDEDNDSFKKAISQMVSYYVFDSDVRNNVNSGLTTVFAFEGLGSYMSDTKGDKNHPQGRYGAMMVVMKGLETVYMTRNASTLPDIPTRPRADTVKEGVYAYASSVHPWAEPNYPALRHQNDPMPVYCGHSAPKHTTGTTFNIHAGGDGINPSSPWSDGCHIIYFADYVAFGKAVGFMSNDAPNMYGSWSGDYGISQIKSYNKTYLVSGIHVLYVLDRTYMPGSQKNGFGIK